MQRSNVFLPAELDTSSVLRHIHKYVDLTNHEIQEILNVVKAKIVRRNQFLWYEGDVCSNIYFVTSGILKLSHFHQKREFIAQFALQDNWISDWHSFTQIGESRFSLSAIEESCVIILPGQAQAELCSRFPKLEKYFRSVFLEALSSQQNRIACMQKPSHDSYAEFLANYSGFETKVSQRHIASFIGITRESLSRIKNQALDRLKNKYG